MHSIRTPLWLVFACSTYALLSLLLYINIPTLKQHMEIDSPAYTRPVELFETHGAFVEPGTTECTNWYSLGYPIWLTLHRAVFGHSWQAMILMQILYGILIILLTYALASYFFVEPVALLSALMASVNLGFLVYAQYILSDLIFTFFMLLGLVLFLEYFLKNKTKTLIASALIFGSSVVIKSAAWYFTLVLALFLLFKQGLRFMHRIGHACLFLLLFFIPIAGYVSRNYNLYGYPYLKAVDKVNLYCFFLPKLIAESENISIQQANKKIESIVTIREYASGKGWERACELFEMKIKQHPFLAFKIWMINVIKTMFGLYTNQLKVLLYPTIRGGDCSFFNYDGGPLTSAWKYLTFGTTSYVIIGIGALETLWTVFRFFLVLFAFIMLLIKRQFLSFFFFGSFIGYFLIITGCDGCGRLRLAIEAPLLILTAFGLYTGYRIIKPKQKHRSMQ